MRKLSQIQEKLRQNRDKALLFTAVGLALILAVTVFPGNMMDRPQQTSSGDVGEFNRADVMFMNMMIIHHDQAIQMAELSENRTENENILELSENISEAQKRENEQMTSWLNQLGYERPVRGHRMAGMASRSEMTELRNSNGSEYDKLFAELMITHHRGGIQMAENFVNRGRNPELKEMEKEMIKAQTKEIKKMQNWQEDWNT